MKKRYLYTSLLFFVSIILFNSCYKDDDDNDVISIVNLPDKIPYNELGSGKMLFHRNYKPYIIDVDKQTVSEIIKDDNGTCVISQDGELIAYDDYMDILHIINIDGSVYAEQTFIDQCFSMISWSLDSKNIIYLDVCYNNLHYLCELSVKENCCTRKIIKDFTFDNFFNSPFSVSKNGKFTFYTNITSTAQEMPWNGLYTMDKNGEEIKCISTAHKNSGRYTHCSPKWCPTEEKIAYISLYGKDNLSTQGIITVEANGSNPDTIVEIVVPPEPFVEGWGARNLGISLCWSSDGTKIAFTRLEGYNVSHIYVIDINTKKLVQVTFEENVQDYHLSWKCYI